MPVTRGAGGGCNARVTRIKEMMNANISYLVLLICRTLYTPRFKLKQHYKGG
jgi:hypothetical protein